MPNNLLLLLPLIAGYLFYRICYYTRFAAQSLDGYGLLFRCTVAGLAFFGLSRITIIVIKSTDVGLPLWHTWSNYVSASAYSGTAAGSIVVSVIAACAINIPIWEVWKRAFNRKQIVPLVRRRFRRYCDLRKRLSRRSLYTRVAFWNPEAWDAMRQQWGRKKRIALNWSTTRQKNQLLILLNEAANRGNVISVTLKNRKYYIGAVKLAPSLDPNETYFRLYPIMSGYRDKDTLELRKTTDYEPIQAAQSEDPVFMTLPIADVEIANPFDPIAFSKYFETQSRAQTHNTQTSGIKNS